MMVLKNLKYKRTENKCKHAQFYLEHLLKYFNKIWIGATSYLLYTYELNVAPVRQTHISTKVRMGAPPINYF